MKSNCKSICTTIEKSFDSINYSNFIQLFFLFKSQVYITSDVETDSEYSHEPRYSIACYEGQKTRAGDLELDQGQTSRRALASLEIQLRVFSYFWSN